MKIRLKEAFCKKGFYAVIHKEIQFTATEKEIDFIFRTIEKANFFAYKNRHQLSFAFGLNSSENIPIILFINEHGKYMMPYMCVNIREFEFMLKLIKNNEVQNITSIDEFNKMLDDFELSFK